MSDSVFKTLSQINVNDRIEKKGKLKYLSWVWAWATVKKIYPDASYETVHFDGKPYLYDEHLGYMVETRVTINGETLPMHLPVMDGSNNAMKSSRYSYKVQEWVNGRKTGNLIDKFVEPATMFDINTAIMRCLAKNLSLFGIGSYIYAGEDMPDVPIELITEQQVLELQTLFESKGYTLQTMLGHWGLNSLGDIQTQNYQSFVDNVNSWGNANG